ncbi:MAG TPA: ABC transporter permease [Symbiobacteriaceae bacterium]|nr:ABC transporter permease [Symbiobacteriaceae bacterium]
MAVFLRRFRRHTSGMAGLALVLLIGLVAVAAPIVTRDIDPLAVDLAISAQPPSTRFWLGTDEMGRSVAMRVIAGAPISLAIAVAGVLLAMIPGVWIGLLAGYYEGRIGSWLMRGIDALVAFPRILLAIVIISIAGQGIIQLMLAVGLASIPVFARVMYVAVQSVRHRDYVQAAVAVGARDRWILLRHILPNAFAPILVQASLNIATSLQIAAGLSFLGLGPAPPTPEWGAIIDGGRTLIRQQPLVIIAPGLAIALTVLGFNLLGDGLRDTLDPRLNR